MKVLVLLEDPTHDQFIARPVVERLFTDMGWSARVDVLTDPCVRGASDLFARLDSIIEDHPMIDLFLVIMDRDCDRANHTSRLEVRLSSCDKAVGCIAMEEIEVWMMAILETSELPAPFSDIRGHCDPKERYVEPYLRAKGYRGSDIGGGRRDVMTGIAGHFRRLTSRCSELRQLRQDLQAMRAAGAI